MTKSILQQFTVLFAALLFMFPAFANNGDPVVQLCSGKEMTWDEYLMFKRLNADDYDIELESYVGKAFIPYRKSFVNNSVGAWSSVIDLPLVPTAAANLPDGKLMTWSAKDKLSFGGNLGRTWTSVFDPANNSATELLIENTQHDMFCPGVTTLPDGRVMATGGSSSEKSSLYDPFTGGWSTNDALNIARGYQTQVTLASGATFTIGGSWSGGVGGKDAEIWSEKSGWFQLPGVPVDVITDGIVSNQPSFQDDYFPWLWVAPNGKLFHAGPSSSMHWIDVEGRGGYTPAGQRGNDPYAISGTTVMYDIGKILKVGGAETFEAQTAASGKSFVIDINSSTAQVNEVESLNYTRNCHNSVVLPSGEVVVFGGMATSFLFSDNNSRLVPELWDPITETWTDMAPMQTPRNYHSVALLMADGRVFVAGGGLCGSCSTNHPDAEIFSPPYLFNSNGTLATRPVINNSPTTANNGGNITVATNDAISSFVLIRNSAVTHSTNSDQRRIPVVATNLGGNQYQLAIPNRNILPPGNYMLFAMNSAGTPSVSKNIQIGKDINNCTPQNNTVTGGTGLQASYFNNVNLTGLVNTQVDSTINFDWGTAAPTGLNPDTYSVRWEGQIKVPRNGTYTFYTNSDDGVRLWVNDKVMIDNWTDHAATEDIAMIHLNANNSYNIRLEYYEQIGAAQIQLSWSGPGLNKDIIPTQNLFPTTNCVPGDSCNDGNPCTINDAYDNNCLCTGTVADADNDGVCDANDICPGFDDNLIGTACDDGNPNTTNDVYQSDCNCAGTPNGGAPDCNNISVTTGNGVLTISGLDGAPISSVQVFNTSWTTVYSCFANCDLPVANISVPDGDYIVYVKYFNASYIQVCQVNDTYTVGGGNGCPDEDNDGVCANVDCDDNNPNLPAAVGSACNDNNPNTSNDVIQSDGCTCAGSNSGPGDCNGVSISTDAGSITVAGLTSPITQVQIFSPSWATVLNCSGNCNSPTEIVNNLSAGTYYVKVRLYTANWGIICDVEEYVTVGGGGCTDNDNDGTCANVDCDDNDPNLPTTVGSSCDDNNANTNNDVIQSDGCTCAGTPIGGGDSCDNISFTFTGGTMTVAGLDSEPIAILQVFNSSWAEVFKCAGNCNGTENLNLPNGTYFVKASLYTSSWSTICSREDFVSSSSNLVSEQAVEDFYFAVAKNGREAGLYWVTNTEYKNERFEIERSDNGIDFQVIESVASTSDFWNAHANYTSNDAAPEAGSNFYRIKKLHRDGTVAYSQIEELQFDETVSDFSVYPNPASDEVFVHLPDFAGEAGVISIYNAYGHLVAQRSEDLITSEALRFSTIDFTSGLYVVTVQVEDQKVLSRKLVIVKK